MTKAETVANWGGIFIAEIVAQLLLNLLFMSIFLGQKRGDGEMAQVDEENLGSFSTNPHSQKFVEMLMVQNDLANRHRDGVSPYFEICTHRSVGITLEEEETILRTSSPYEKQISRILQLNNGDFCHPILEFGICANEPFRPSNNYELGMDSFETLEECCEAW